MSQDRDPAAVTAQRQANGGTFAIWLTMYTPTPKARGRDRVGKTRLKLLMPQAKLDQIAVEVGGPVFALHTSKRTAPVIYVRANYARDFREMLRALALAAGRGSFNVWDATEDGYSVVRSGIEVNR